MWKYTTKEQCNQFLLSLNLINNKCSNKEKIIKLYTISNNVESNYKIFKIKKSNGKYRKIYEPNGTLKHIQRQILHNILNNKQISQYAYAYHRGISLKDNAIPHINKDMILKLDIKNFFDNISFIDIYKACFPLAYFPKSVGMLLTCLCTYNNYLPQGAPSSAYISNLVMKDFDEEIGKWCDKNNIAYTRYSDDMTFSGNFNPTIIIKMIRKRLYKLGLELNDKKIHLITKNKQQKVTGIVVNKKVQVAKDYRKKIRQEVYYIKKYGLDSHLKYLKFNGSKEYYLNKLYGKILYVLQTNNTDKEFGEYKEFIYNYIKLNK